jgi:hypothetical protein
MIELIVIEALWFTGAGLLIWLIRDIREYFEKEE